MDMLTFLETASGEENERMEYMLHEISDLSTDEDSPTMNTGGHRRNLANGTSSQLASAFVYGAAANQLSGCDNGPAMGQTTSGISFTTMVLTLWTLSLGAYTWYWLRQPLRMVGAHSSTRTSRCCTSNRC